jgi:hypothetical protein
MSRRGEFQWKDQSFSSAAAVIQDFLLKNRLLQEVFLIIMRKQDLSGLWHFFPGVA